MFKTVQKITNYAIFLGEYCMPLKGTTLSKQSNILKNDELVRLVSLFADQGVNKIRITGGEPTIKKDIVQIVGKFENSLF